MKARKRKHGKVKPVMLHEAMPIKYGWTYAENFTLLYSNKTIVFHRPYEVEGGTFIRSKPHEVISSIKICGLHTAGFSRNIDAFFPAYLVLLTKSYIVEERTNHSRAHGTWQGSYLVYPRLCEYLSQFGMDYEFRALCWCGRFSSIGMLLNWTGCDLLIDGIFLFI